MTKSEWVDTIAEKTGLSKKEAAAALDALTSTITDGLKDEGKLAVPSPGAFQVKELPHNTAAHLAVPFPTRS